MTVKTYFYAIDPATDEIVIRPSRPKLFKAIGREVPYSRVLGGTIAMARAFVDVYGRAKLAGKAANLAQEIRP